MGDVSRLLAADLRLGWAILRGFRDRKRGRVCSGVWVGAGR